MTRIPHHGLGLSVDVYTPDLFELVEALERNGLDYGYLEIFKAAPAALELVRRRLPASLLSYHAEGLWVTQPDPARLSPFHAELDETAEQLGILGSHWLNHECAAKQMAGYSFGTYLPALFTEASAEVTAANIAQAQQRLDRQSAARDGLGPLFLLETPPLTYAGFGDLGLADFFRLVTDRTPCGLVLDIGHLWTIYRYTGEWRRRPLTAFLAELLDAFPLERVVEIHMAGLAPHERVPEKYAAGEPPLWIDAHGAPIPDVLTDMLVQVIEHKGLAHLKGVALEVDTKQIPMIVEEFTQARERFGDMVAPRVQTMQPHLGREESSPLPLAARPAPTASRLAEQYDRYARIVTGRDMGGLPVLGQEASALALYVDHYLPHEILEWGGAVREMFPETCRSLERAGIPLSEFVRFWFREPREADQAYDFFLLKIARFVEFVREVLPDALETAEREAQALREGYRAANEMVGTAS
ncbi:MAG: multinuclear nonheme iron-dependent oxidase [Nitrospiraceae bacterium]